jgi:hypothetical protein
MPLIHVSQVVYDEIVRRQDAIRGTAEQVIVAAIEQTSTESTAQYHRRRFYAVEESDVRWLLRPEPGTAR